MKEHVVSFDRKQSILIAVIFLASLSLRLGLALYNRQANDPHMPVIRSILREGSLPEEPDCHECFQPKFFHFAVAKILDAARLDQSRDADAQIVVVQLINFLMGAGLLLASWIFLRSLAHVPAWIRIMGFALVAFNPQLIGINSQVTNDTFLILFCVMTVYGAYLAVHNEGPIWFLVTVIFSFLAVITKTNGWVVVIAITLAFLCKVSIGPGQRNSPMPYFMILFPLLVAGLAVASPLSQYVTNFRQYGSPFLINIERQPRPLFFTETQIPYAGILSVQDGFLSFKLADLLKNPITDLQEKVDDTSHRTSLWTRMYGSANSIHFENYPPSWRQPEGSAKQFLFMINRGIFLLALSPILVMLVGAAMEIYGTVRAILRKDATGLAQASYGLFAILFGGFVIFIALYAFEYRVYAVMKAVFIYPGLLAYVLFFVKGAARITAKSKIWTVGLAVWVSALLILYILDVAFLIIHLLPNGSGIDLILESLGFNWW